jgi:hypothetical protein
VSVSLSPSFARDAPAELTVLCGAWLGVPDAHPDTPSPTVKQIPAITTNLFMVCLSFLS